MLHCSLLNQLGKLLGVLSASAGASVITSTLSAIDAASVAYTTPQEALPFATQFKTSVTFVPKLAFFFTSFQFFKFIKISCAYCPAGTLLGSPNAIVSAFVTSLKEAVPQSTIMMISGNHDSAPRIDCFRQVLLKQNLYMVGNPPEKEEDHIERITLNDTYGPVHFYLLPFVKPSMVKNIIGTNDGRNYSYSETIKKLIEREEMNTKDRNVLISHQFYLPVNKKAEDIERTDSEIRTAGNIDEVSGEVLLPFDYAALGHIHKPMKVGSDVYRYCGTPLPYSMSEAGQDKGIIEIEMKEKGVVETQVLPLKPLHDLRIIEGELKDVLSQSCDDFVRVVLTDKQDLNIFEMQEKLKNAFPRLLEIRRENIRKNNYQAVVKKDVKMDPFSLCTDFLNGVDEEEKDLLQDIINHVKGV